MTKTQQQLSLLAELPAAIGFCSGAEKQALLFAMAEEIRRGSQDILCANAQDMAAAQGKISGVMLDRLQLDAGRIESMAQGVEAVAQLPDPVGRILSKNLRPNGLIMEKMAVPMGVIAIIYESRPNVTSDAAALALMAGSACVLRSGKEAHATAAAIVRAMQKALQAKNLPLEIITLLEDTSRESAMEVMTAKGHIDLLIPRGGKGLISACVDHATVPVLETGTGICHGYVDKEADFALALDIIENAKTSRPSVCNAMEVCLLHQEIAQEFLPLLRHRLIEERREKNLPEVIFREGEFDTEFLDYVLGIGVVSSLEEAISHINLHSTGHSEVIISKNPDTAGKFCRGVDSAAVYVNASTRFTDGGEFGLGCEMGISTQKLHARGPLGLEELCTYKFVITGTGQVR